MNKILGDKLADLEKRINAIEKRESVAMQKIGLGYEHFKRDDSYEGIKVLAMAFVVTFVVSSIIFGVVMYFG